MCYNTLDLKVYASKQDLNLIWEILITVDMFCRFENYVRWIKHCLVLIWNSSDKEIPMRPSRKLTRDGVGVKNWLDGGRESPRSEIDRSDAHWLACGIGFAVTNIGFWHSVLDVTWLISGRSSGLLANLSCDVHMFMHPARQARPLNVSIHYLFPHFFFTLSVKKKYKSRF